jgi:hypothetical protein
MTGKKLLLHRVRGTEKTWDLEFSASREQLEAMRRDGLIVGEIENMVPDSLPWFIPVRWWNFAQDVLGFRNPWRNG